MKDDYLFVVEKSIFANSHELFFWVFMTFDFLLTGLVIGPLFGQLGLDSESLVYSLFGKMLPVGFWTFLSGIAFKIICISAAVISLIVTVFIVVNIKTYKAVFYKDRIVIHGGFIARWEKQMPLTPIVGVHMKQSFFGRLFDYASFTVDKVGDDEWNLIADGRIGELNGPESILFRVSEASAVKECLEEMVTRTKGEISSFVGNHETSGEGKPHKLAV